MTSETFKFVCYSVRKCEYLFKNCERVITQFDIDIDDDSY